MKAPDARPASHPWPSPSAVGSDSAAPSLDCQALRVLERLTAGIQHELNTPLGALSSAADTVARLLERRHRALAAGQLQSQPELALAAPPELSAAARELATIGVLCAVIEESARRIAEVVRGLEQLASRYSGAGGLDGLENALALVEHQGRVRLAASARPPATPC